MQSNATNNLLWPIDYWASYKLGFTKNKIGLTLGSTFILILTKANWIFHSIVFIFLTALGLHSIWRTLTSDKSGCPIFGGTIFSVSY